MAKRGVWPALVAPLFVLIAACAPPGGGGEEATVYRSDLESRDPEDPSRYLYDGEWRQLEGRTVEVSVAGEAKPREATFWDAHHGPIVARRGDRAYAAALDVRQIMPQNVMIADSQAKTWSVPNPSASSSAAATSKRTSQPTSPSRSTTPAGSG